MGRPVDDIYSTTFGTMRRLNHRYHHRFPDDGDRLKRLLDLCDEGEVRDPDGVPITRRLMRTIGNLFGKDGGAEAVHYLLERDPRSPAFAHDCAAAFPFDARNPLYAIIHESSYADGVPTRWSAERVEPDDFRGDSQLLTGEHLFSWHFEDYAGLQPTVRSRPSSPSNSGPGSSTRRCSPRWTSPAPQRSTPTTHSSTGSSRSRAPTCCQGCVAGSPTSTCTTGCAAVVTECSTD